MTNYKFYWNLQVDEKGRSISMCDGFTVGDPLCIAYEGEIDPAVDWLGTAELLFHKFNMDRPDNYRGPSMSVGSVIEFDGKAYAVASCGFVEVDISGSEVRPTDPRW
jgi:hypothetical protein